jgi:hypothetical protein
MGCLVSLGSESYKLPSVEFVDELQRFLDSQMPVSKTGDRLCLEPSSVCWAGTLLRSGWGNDTSPQDGSCRLTFGYRTRTC